ncbi:MAG: T9SS type A sorting domain-containing protein [Lewinellaceae bacterium]|nr:T9SS type A sorting domain-containing protein [Lewinellaceae bacterium]
MKNQLLLLCLLFPLFAHAQLSGAYTIGGASPDYATIAAAVTALNQSGVNGPVVFNIRNGSYVEQAMMNAIPGSSAVNTVTFQSESGDSTAVTWEWGTGNLGANYVFFAQNLTNVHFKKLTLKRPATGNNGRTVAYLSTCDNIYFENCVISGSGEANNYQEDLIEAGYCSSLYFVNNRFVNGYTAVTSAGNYLGPFTGYAFFEHNFFENQRDAGVYCIYLDHVDVIENTFTSVNKNGCTAIQIADSDNASTITRNSILFDNTILSGNTGIEISNKSASAANTLIANNMIGAFGGNGGSNGISVKSSTGVDIFFNTVRTRKTPGYECYAISIWESQQTGLLNNNFVCEGSPTVAYFQGTTDTGDYNNYYTEPGVNWLNTLDAGPNCHSVDPNFLSSTDLHIATSDLADAGMPLAGISEDFDGDLRDPLHPDIGADEFLPADLDVGILQFNSPVRFVPYCDTLPDMVVTLKNYGLNTLTSATIVLTVNAIPHVTFNWTGDLPYLGEEEVNLGSFPFVDATRYDLQAFTTSPNGLADEYLKNDTASFLNFHMPLSGNYSLGGPGADFATLSEMNANLVNAGLCGPTTILIADGAYDDNIIIDTLPGSSAVNTLWITSASQDSSKVVITDDYPSPYKQIVFLDGVSYVTLSHLTFDDDGAGLDDLIRFRRGHDLAVTNCKLLGYYCNCAQNTDKGIYAVAVDSNLTIRQNLIQLSGGGFTLSGNLVNGRDVSVHFLVEQNLVYGSVLWLETARPVIRDNIFNGSFSRIEQCGGFEITHNQFYGGFALYTSSGDSASLFQNNALYHYEPNGASVSWDWALYLLSTSDVDIIHNTLKGAFNAGALGVNFCSDVRAYNNIFYQGAFNSNNVVSQNTSGSLISDHNLFFRSDSSVYVLTYRQTNFGQDLNSYFIDPKFSTDPDSLFYPTNGLMSNLAFPMGVADDLFHQPRDPNFPEMGAIELSLVPAVDLGPDRELCEGLLLDALNPGATYLWSDGSTGQTLLVEENGQYWVQVSTPLGTVSDTVNITLIPAPIVLLQDTTICTGDSAVISANVDNATFLWSTGDTTSSIQVSQPGFYTLTATNSLGCSDQDTMQVTFHPVPEIEFQIANETCLGDASGMITVIVTGGQGDYSYAWENSPVVESVLSDLPPGIYTLLLTDGSCSYSDSAEVLPGIDPQAVILNADSACVNEPYLFLNGSTDADEYSWYIGGSLESQEPEFEFTFESPATYLISLVAAAGECFDTAYYALVVQNDSICNPASSVFEENVSYRIFPNPVKDLVFIQGLSPGTIVEIYDVTGVTRIREEDTDGVIEVLGLPEGVYFLRVWHAASTLHPVGGVWSFIKG